jgi:serine/threonine protein phosphatase PrpC
MTKFECISDIGKKRTINEDYYGYCQIKQGDIFIVCDGMGGHNAGEIASKLATETIIEFVKSSTETDIRKSLVNAIQHTNNEVFLASQKEENKGMGTTLVCVFIQDNLCYYAHVGDSRIYSLVNNKLSPLTEDHSYVNQLLNAGIINEQEAKNHPKKNIITNAIGIREKIEISICEQPLALKDNQYLLLCTDGLSNLVHEETIAQIILSNKTLKEKANELVNEANQAGGNDNITALMIKYNDDTHTQKKMFRKRILISVLISFLCLGSFALVKLKKENQSSESNYNNVPTYHPKNINYDLSCMGEDELDPTTQSINFFSTLQDEFVSATGISITPQQEMELGKDYHNELLKTSKIIVNPRLTKILNDLTSKLNQSKYTYHIYEIKNDTINAFTFGGYIYVHSGILKFIGQNNHELAAIISHEINHNELGHINKRLSMEETTNQFLGNDLSGFVLSMNAMITTAFNQKDEVMCDLTGMDLMIKANYAPCNTIGLWKRMSNDEGKFNVLENITRSHPYSANRAKCCENHLLKNYKWKCN